MDLTGIEQQLFLEDAPLIMDVFEKFKQVRLSHGRRLRGAPATIYVSMLLRVFGLIFLHFQLILSDTAN
jgi:hypothetical protein